MNIVIVGCGISGLTSAWILQKFFKKEIKITFVEKSERIGGLIRTDKINGFLCERGPRSLKIGNNSHEIVELIQEVGLKDELISCSTKAKNRYLWHSNRLHCIPNSLLQTVTSPIFRDLLYTFFREGWRTQKLIDDESIFDFISRRYSAEVANRLIDPLVACIYGGNINELSIRSCFKFLKDFEDKEGSILKGVVKQLFKPKVSSEKKGLYTLKNGLESLPKMLFKKLQADCYFNTEVIHLNCLPSSVQLELSNGNSIAADYVVWAGSLDSFTNLLKIPSIHLPHSSIAVINTGWNTKVLPFEGFGCVFPSREMSSLLGIVWDSSAFPEQNAHPEQTRLTLMLGGTRDKELHAKSDSVLEEKTIYLLKRYLKINVIPDMISIFRANNAIPLYPVGYENAIQSLKDFLKMNYPRLFTVGNAWDSVGLNASISHAHKISYMLGEFAKKKMSN